MIEKANFNLSNAGNAYFPTTIDPLLKQTTDKTVNVYYFWANSKSSAIKYLTRSEALDIYTI